MTRFLLAVVLTFLSVASTHADVKLSAIIGDNMVLQRGMPVPIWGWADAGEKVTVSFAGQTHSATAGKDGKWTVKLEAMKASAKPQPVVIKGKNSITLKNVLIGEVWICSGQSNMAWSVNRANDADLEMAAAKFLNIRMISVPQVGTQEAKTDFNGQWEACTPAVAANFSAVGYFFGRQLHQTLDVPIGLIDNAWGGSAAEAWVPKEVLAKHERYAALLKQWDDMAKAYDHTKAMTAFKAKQDKWKEAVKKAKAAGKPAPRAPRAPRNQLTGQHRPGNLYNGVLNPTIGYAIKGAIWYQGESNSGRAYQYRHLFPLMIDTWREVWKQGDFSFYWVQLADFMDESDGPQDSAWAELREAQTMTMSRLPNTGEAVIIDVGEGRDIHPRDKQTVGKRLARWALAKDYGMKIPHQSPTVSGMEIVRNKVTLTFDHVGAGLYSFDSRTDVSGFTLAGEDQKFVKATARIVGKNKIELTAQGVDKPVHARYAWANNPVVNLYSREGLPATPFRTDDWKGVTEGKETR